MINNNSDRYRVIAYSRYKNDTTPDYGRYAQSYARRLSGRLHPESNWRCLDIACGYGNFLAYLRGVGVRDYMGMDMAEQAIAVAQKEFGKEHAMAGDIFHFLRSHKTHFHLLSSLDFIEHLHKHEVFEFLGVAYQALQETGFLLLRTPNAGAPFGMAARYNDITHETCFTSTAIADTLASCGFRTVCVWEDTALPRTPAQLAHWIAWKGARLLFRLGSAAETGAWGDGILTRNMWVLARKSPDPI